MIKKMFSKVVGRFRGDKGKKLEELVAPVEGGYKDKETGVAIEESDLFIAAIALEAFKSGEAIIANRQSDGRVEIKTAPGISDKPARLDL